MFRPEDFAELLLRLRPIGLALRATEAAPNRKGNIFFMARPPLLCEEGNLLTDAGFVHSSSTLMPSRGGESRAHQIRVRNSEKQYLGGELGNTPSRPA